MKKVTKTKEKEIASKNENVVIGVLYFGKTTKGVCIYNANTQKVNNIISTMNAKKRYKEGNLKTLNATFNFYVNKKVLFTIGDQTMYPHVKIVDKEKQEWEIEKGIVIYKTETKKKDGERYFKAIRIENKDAIKAGWISEGNLVEFHKSGYKCNYNIIKGEIVDLGENAKENEVEDAQEITNKKMAIDTLVGSDWYILNKSGNMVKKSDCPLTKWQCYLGINGVDGFAKSNIEEVDLSGCKKVLTDAFKNCKELRSVKFSETLEEIQSNAFVGCTKLKELYIPKSCKRLGYNIMTKGDVYLYTTTKMVDSFKDGVKIHFIDIENKSVKKIKKQEDGKVGVVAVAQNGNMIKCFNIYNENGNINTKEETYEENDLMLSDDIINYDYNKGGRLNANNEIVIIGRAGLNYVTIDKMGEIKLANLADLRKEKIANGNIITIDRDKEKDYEIIQSNGKDWIIFDLKKETKSKIERIDGISRQRRIAKTLSALSNIYDAFNNEQINALNEFYGYELSKIINNKVIALTVKNKEIRDNYKGVDWFLRGWQVGGHPDSDNKYGTERCCFGHVTIYHWVVEGINKKGETEAILTFGSNCVCHFMGFDKEDFKKIKVFEDKAKFEMEYLNKIIAENKVIDEKEDNRLLYDIVEKLRKENKFKDTFKEIAIHIDNFDKVGLVYTNTLAKEMARKLAGRCLDDFSDKNYILDDELRSKDILMTILDDKETIEKLYRNYKSNIEIGKIKTEAKGMAMAYEYALAYNTYAHTKIQKTMDYRPRTIEEEVWVNKVHNQKDSKTRSLKGLNYRYLYSRWRYTLEKYYEDKNTFLQFKKLDDLNEYTKKIKEGVEKMKDSTQFIEDWDKLNFEEGAWLYGDKYYVDTRNETIIKLNDTYNIDMTYNANEDTLRKDEASWNEFLTLCNNNDKRTTRGRAYLSNEQRIIKWLKEVREKNKCNELSDNKYGIFVQCEKMGKNINTGKEEIKDLYLYGIMNKDNALIPFGFSTHFPNIAMKYFIKDGKVANGKSIIEIDTFVKIMDNDKKIVYVQVDDKEFKLGGDEGKSAILQVKGFIERHEEEIIKAIKEKEENKNNEIVEKRKKKIEEILDDEYNRLNKIAFCSPYNAKSVVFETGGINNDIFCIANNKGFMYLRTFERSEGYDEEREQERKKEGFAKINDKYEISEKACEVSKKMEEKYIRNGIEYIGVTTQQYNARMYAFNDVICDENDLVINNNEISIKQESKERIKQKILELEAKYSNIIAKCKNEKNNTQCCFVYDDDGKVNQDKIVILCDLIPSNEKTIYSDLGEFIIMRQGTMYEERIDELEKAKFEQVMNIVGSDVYELVRGNGYKENKEKIKKIMIKASKNKKMYEAYTQEEKNKEEQESKTSTIKYNQEMEEHVYNKLKENIDTINEWGGAYASLYNDILSKPLESLSFKQKKSMYMANKQYNQWKKEK